MVSSERLVEPYSSGPTRKRPRLLDEAVKEGGDDNGVALKFSESFAADNQSLVLLQVPESLLDELGRDAHLDLVKLVGGEDQDAVLVTGRQTFKLTKAETSNTLLLLPPEGSGAGGGGRDAATAAAAGTRQGFQAVAAVGFQYEITKATPCLEQIREVLGACLYRGEEEEASVDRERLDVCSLAELQDRVQFSHRELLEGLKELEAVQIDGRWRLLEPALMEQTADALLGVIVEQGMPLDRVDIKACVSALPEFEALVLEHCLKVYSADGSDVKAGTTATGNDSSGSDSAARENDSAPAAVFYRLDLDKVARLRAHQILRTREAEGHDRPLSLTDFMEQWATSMPGVETPDEELLKGIALIERKGADDKSASVVYVPASSLPFDAAERLAELFRIKPKWPMEELEPYISEADRKAGFLLKHARFSTDPATGRKLFSAR